MCEPVLPETVLSPPEDLRCACGSLLARFEAGVLELKCRRCKRLVRVRIPGGRAVRIELGCPCGARA